MDLYSEGKSYKLYEGSMLDMLGVIAPDSVDSIVTDPPYELNFMHKGWDSSGIAFQASTWEKCLSVLKPGGYLLAFGGSRTYHRIACAIEDAGFEIRDTIIWMYGSGFPKSLNVAKGVEAKLTTGGASPKNQRITSMGEDYEPTGQTDYHHGLMFKNNDDTYVHNDGNMGFTHPESQKWRGWGTALKPAYEPIIVARNPCEGTCVDNVLKYGVGGINIDECRVETTDTYSYKRCGGSSFGIGKGNDGTREYSAESNPLGRYPSNIILTYDDSDYKEVCGGMPETENNTKSHLAKNSDNNVNFNASKIVNIIGYSDAGSASRYFYCAKASARDRDEGCDDLEDGLLHRVNSGGLENDPKFMPIVRKNIHPTVKPCDLMQYLVRLVTPKGGTVLDPFNGSGSTGKAVMYENRDRASRYNYIGIELTPEYLPISDARIKFVEERPNTIRLFDL